MRIIRYCSLFKILSFIHALIYWTRYHRTDAVAHDFRNVSSIADVFGKQSSLPSRIPNTDKLVMGAVLQRDSKSSDNFSIIWFVMSTEDGSNFDNNGAPSTWRCRFEESQNAVAETHVFTTPSQHTPSSLYFITMTCSVPSSHSTFLSTSNRLSLNEIAVSLFDFANTNAKILVSIPLASRYTGFMSIPPIHMSKLDVWAPYSSVQVNQPFYLVVPCVAIKPTKQLLLVLLEFIQYHILLGVNHVFIGTAFSWDSVEMNNLCQALRTFIDSSHLTIVSLFSERSSITLAFKQRIQLKRRRLYTLYFSNLILHLSKGLASKIGIWDFECFFTPKPAFHDIAGVLRAASMKANTGSYSKNTKNEDVCYLKWVPVRINRDRVPNSDTWIGDLFGEYIYVSQQSPGGSAVILTVNTVGHIGEYGIPEVCSVESCSSGDSSCLLSESVDVAIDNYKPSMRQEVSNAVHVDMDHMGIANIFHYITPLQRKQSGREPANKLDKGKTTKIVNSYRAVYYPNVIRLLKQRGVEVLASLPDATSDWRRINYQAYSGMSENGWFQIDKLEFNTANSVPFETTDNFISDASNDRTGRFSLCIISISEVY